MRLIEGFIGLSVLQAVYSSTTACISEGGWSFRIESIYNVDDNDANSNDVQCSYDILLTAFEEDVFNRILLKDDDCTNSVEDEFLAQLGVETVDEGQDVVYDLCGEAQNKMRQM